MSHTRTVRDGEESRLVSEPVAAVSGGMGLGMSRKTYPDCSHGTTRGEEVEHARTKLRHQGRRATLFCSVILVASRAAS